MKKLTQTSLLIKKPSLKIFLFLVLGLTASFPATSLVVYPENEESLIQLILNPQSHPCKSDQIKVIMNILKRDLHGTEELPVRENKKKNLSTPSQDSNFPNAKNLQGNILYELDDSMMEVVLPDLASQKNFSKKGNKGENDKNLSEDSEEINSQKRFSKESEEIRSKINQIIETLTYSENPTQPLPKCNYFSLMVKRGSNIFSSIIRVRSI